MLVIDINLEGRVVYQVFVYKVTTLRGANESGCRATIEPGGFGLGLMRSMDGKGLLREAIHRAHPRAVQAATLLSLNMMQFA